MLPGQCRRHPSRLALLAPQDDGTFLLSACGDHKMASESARMSSAAEARFRIDAPNSQARAVKVIALDATSEHVVKALSQLPWQRASFLTASSFSGAPRHGEPFSMGGWLNDL